MEISQKNVRFSDHKGCHQLKPFCGIVQMAAKLFLQNPYSIGDSVAMTVAFLCKFLNVAPVFQIKKQSVGKIAVVLLVVSKNRSQFLVHILFQNGFIINLIEQFIKVK